MMRGVGGVEGSEWAQWVTRRVTEPALLYLCFRGTAV